MMPLIMRIMRLFCAGSCGDSKTQANDLPRLTHCNKTLLYRSSCCCVGWAMRDTMEVELALSTLRMARAARRPASGLIHHSDRGSQLGFNRSSQHHPLNVIAEADRVPRPVCANAAARLIKTFGGIPEVRSHIGTIVIRSTGCPLAALTSENPAACRVIEGLLTEYLGTPAKMCCTQEPEPRCCFEIAP